MSIVYELEQNQLEEREQGQNIFSLFSLSLFFLFIPSIQSSSFAQKMLVKHTFVVLVSFLVVSSVLANKKRCEKACTKVYDPICARSKTGELKEFGNTCTFEIAVCSEPYLRWQEANKGPCEDPKKKCEKACTKEYNPTCARSKTGELKEFGNPCMFEIAVCSEPYLRWQEVNKGPCDCGKSTEPLAV
jgi:hypothetical protein